MGRADTRQMTALGDAAMKASRSGYSSIVTLCLFARKKSPVVAKEPQVTSGNESLKSSYGSDDPIGG